MLTLLKKTNKKTNKQKKKLPKGFAGLRWFPTMSSGQTLLEPSKWTSLSWLV